MNLKLKTQNQQGHFVFSPPVSQAGFTLTETLVAVGLFVLIGMGVAMFGRDIFFLNTNTQNNLGAQLDGHRVLKNLVAELRTASESSLGAYPVMQAGTSTITFYANIDNDSQKERIRYYLSGTTFMRGVLNPSGNPLAYSGTESTQILINNVRNGATPIFDYFDKNYTGTSSALSIPVSVSDIRLVRATIIIEADPNRSPRPITITSQAFLRNLKDNL